MLFFGSFATPAYAYLDPGTGSMILQLVLGGVAGIAVAGRFYWDRLLVMLRIRSDTKDGEASDDKAGSTNGGAD